MEINEDFLPKYEHLSGGKIEIYLKISNIYLCVSCFLHGQHPEVFLGKME